MDINNLSELSLNYNELIDLRKQKIILNPIGTLPRNSQQNHEFGLPIAIMDYQYDLVKKHRGFNINNQDKSDNIYKIVYEDLILNRGYYVQEGNKYGCDFLIYKDDPDKCHSFALLYVFSFQKDIIKIKELILWQRISNKVNKKCIFALVLDDKNTNLYKKKILYLNFENYISDLKIIK